VTTCKLYENGWLNGQICKSYQQTKYRELQQVLRITTLFRQVDHNVAGKLDNNSLLEVLFKCTPG